VTAARPFTFKPEKESATPRWDVLDRRGNRVGEIRQLRPRAFVIRAIDEAGNERIKGQAETFHVARDRVCRTLRPRPGLIDVRAPDHGDECANCSARTDVKSLVLPMYANHSVVVDLCAPCRRTLAEKL
jgi:hypothetical protein